MRPILAVVVLLSIASGCLDSNAGAWLSSYADSPGLPTRGPPGPPEACRASCYATVANGTYREFEPMIALDPHDARTVVVSAAEDLIADAPGYVESPVESPVSGSKGLLQTPGSYRIGVHTSHDGGATWATNFLPWLGHAPPTSAWNAYCVYGDPLLMYAPDGVLHVVSVAAECATELKADQTFHLIHAASPDDGATWGEPSLVFPGQLLAFANDKPWAAIDPATGRIAVTWTGFVGLGTVFQGLMVSVSDDGGRTWSLPSVATRAGALEVLVDTPLYDEAYYNYDSSVVWGPEGSLHVAFMGYCESPPPSIDSMPDCVKVANSVDLGRSWTVEVISRIANPGRPGARQVEAAYPALAAARTGGVHDGRLYVAYPDASTGDYDALLRWSDDGGATWSAPVRLSTDAPGNGADQFHVGLAVDGRGRVHAGFWDRRADPENRAIQTTWATFDPASGRLANLALEPAWDPDPANIGGQFLGDYSTVAAFGDRVGLAWDVATPQKAGTRNTNIPWDLDVRAAVFGAR